tara:strand:+ start:2070 stop:2585 length:516 start_codon:yes stop_codon:yes gene_type:complete
MSKEINIKDLALYGLAIFGGYALYDKIKKKGKFFNQIGIGGTGPANCWSGCPNSEGIFSQQGLCPNTHPNMMIPNCVEDLPGINEAFISNIQFGISQYGCGFLNNQLTSLQKKLNQSPESNSLNNIWQQRLVNRIEYIKKEISKNCGEGKTDVASTPLFGDSVHPNLPRPN